MGRDFFKSVYVVRCASVRGAMHLSPDESIDEELQICRGNVVPSVPLRFRRMMGRKPHDFLSTSLVSLKLVSSRVIQVFRENGFTGWSTYLVRVRGKDNEQLDGYHGLAVKGRCGHIDKSMSERVWRDPPSPQGNRYQTWLGLYFDPKSWDGSDIFGPDNNYFVFVVERVKEAMEKAGLTNFSFERLTEFELEMLP